MKRRCLVLLVVLAIAGCATPGRTWGTASANAHDVSVYELLGRPDYFDGEHVRIIGVAGFDFGFEGVSGIYGSAADQRHRTNTYVALQGFAADISSARKDLERLNGHFIIVEGVFRSLNTREKNDPDASELSICVGSGCNTPGVIETVTRVSEWEF
jgi:hypothetical protein